MRSLFGRGVTVADRIWILAPVGIFAVTILTQMAPLALAATDVVLDENQVTFLEAFATSELAPRFGDVADILVAHDHGARRRRRLVELHVGAANAGDLHAQQRAVR